jgi:hypothetical protein
MLTGEAECQQCDTLSIFLLTGEWEPSESGGKWWIVAAGQSCPHCGEPWRYMHQSPPYTMDMSMSVKLPQTIGEAR